jgi:phosphinothricin acetyltransferase
MDKPVVIRAATTPDLPAITEIYNEAIRTTTATFDIQPKSEADQAAWFNAHSGRHPILVAVVEGRIVGWASLTRWSDRRAYDDTGEVSFYVQSRHRVHGIGRKLTDAIIEEARRHTYHSLIARVAGESSVSLHLSRTAGFADVGVMKEVGRKFGRLLDVHILQKMHD